MSRRAYRLDFPLFAAAEAATAATRALDAPAAEREARIEAAGDSCVGSCVGSLAGHAAAAAVPISTEACEEEAAHTRDATRRTMHAKRQNETVNAPMLAPASSLP